MVKIVIRTFNWVLSETKVPIWCEEARMDGSPEDLVRAGTQPALHCFILFSCNVFLVPKHVKLTEEQLEAQVLFFTRFRIRKVLSAKWMKRKKFITPLFFDRNCHTLITLKSVKCNRSSPRETLMLIILGRCVSKGTKYVPSRHHASRHERCNMEPTVGGIGPHFKTYSRSG